jgi:hypothetical protein
MLSLIRWIQISPSQGQYDLTKEDHELFLYHDLLNLVGGSDCIHTFMRKFSFMHVILITIFCFISVPSNENLVSCTSDEEFPNLVS